MTELTQLQKQRKKAVNILLERTGKTVPTLIDYHIDDWVRNILNLPPRPNGQDPYEGWMVGEAVEAMKRKKTSEVGIALIKKWEGCRLNAYLCPAKVWTIGYGHTKGVKQGDEITMPVIMSPYDTRLVTLIGVAIDLAEELALARGGTPDERVATSLYLANKRVHEWGEEMYLNKLATQYPLLKEAIT